MSIDLPVQHYDPIDTVIVLQFEPQVAEPPGSALAGPGQLGRQQSADQSTITGAGQSAPQISVDSGTLLKGKANQDNIVDLDD